MSHINIENSVMQRGICIDIAQCNQYRQFFMGWSGASERITPEQTYVLVDKLKGRKVLDLEIGELYGRVKSYQGLIFLNAEIPLPEALFQAICHVYD